MSALATRDGAALGLPGPNLGGESSPALFEPSRVTLEDFILGVWEDLRLEGRADCPVCGVAELHRGGCASCGSQLG